jgi:hypothetical protein
MMQATSDPSSTQEFSSSSLPGFTSGAQSSSLAIDAPSQMIQIPPAHVIEAAKPPPPRILKLSHEELDAWRQILTLYKQQQINTIQTHSAP